MNNLKTNCNSCDNKIDPNGCKIDKLTYNEEENQYTNGFCGFKQPSGRYLCLSMIVLLTCNCINKLDKTLVDLDKDNGFVKQIIVTCSQKVHSTTKKTVVEIVQNLNVETKSLNLILDEHLTDNDSLIHNSCLFVENEWFFPINAGDRFPWEKLESIRSFLEASNQNPVAFYNIYDHWLVNKRAFDELGGNTDRPFEEKIKAFDNWEEVCKKIQ